MKTPIEELIEALEQRKGYFQEPKDAIDYAIHKLEFALPKEKQHLIEAHNSNKEWYDSDEYSSHGEQYYTQKYKT